MASPLIPPLNFGCVEPGLYRSGHPVDLNHPFLEQLHLRTVIDLSPDEPSQRFKAFLKESNINLLHFEISEPSPWKPNWEAMVQKAINTVLNPEHAPILVMCNHGRHRTGTVIGCLRKLQRWNMVAIFEEYRRYAGENARVMNEQFIELFDTDLVNIPNSPPAWL